jgi:opacity protein-like surface antigen
MLKTFLSFFVVTASAYSQPISFGAKIGLPLGDAYNIATSNRSFSSDATQYTVGAGAELHLPLGFSVEGDILYNRFNFSTENLLNPLSKANSNSLEFPILAKYRFAGFGPLHAFVGAGPSFRSIQSVLRFDPRTTNDSFGKGVVFAGGVEIKALFLRITPELRYTHWGSQSFLDGANVLIRGKQSQGQFLVGIGF